MKKLKKIKKENEARPEALEHDRNKILEYKNTPSLR